MRLLNITSLLLVAICCWAQDPTPLTTSVEGIRFPPLAKQARIQGDIVFNLTNNAQLLPVSGHPLLVPTAAANLAAIATELSAGGAQKVVYHFILIDPEIIRTVSEVNKGDAFDRLMIRVFNQVTLRAFKLKTTKMVEQYEYRDTTAPKNRIDRTGDTVEIWVYATTPTIQMETTRLVASR